MKSPFFPVFTTPTVIETDRTTFHKFEEEVTISVPADLIKELIGLCDGTKTVKEIAGLLKSDWEKDYIVALFEELHKNDLVSSKIRVTESTWKAVQNPSPFPSEATDQEVSQIVKESRERHRSNPPKKEYDTEKTGFHEVLNRRKSVRSFSGETVEFQSIVNMLWAAYGETKTASKKHNRKTVPSAGAFYPSLIHLILFEDTEEIDAGVYKVYLGSAEKVGFKLISENTKSVIQSFVDPLTPENSHGVIVVSGSFQKSERKYGNRGLLYTVLEAGHIAQNVHIAAHESEIATLEVGGFYEKLLSDSLELDENHRPLTTVIFGTESESKTDENAPHIETHWQAPFVDQFRLEFNIMLARIDDGTERNWSSGKAASPRLAKAKALSEAREWAAYKKAPDNLKRARLGELDNVIHPHEVFKLHKSQFAVDEVPYRPFQEKEEYAWVQATDMLRDSKAHVLADHVYTHHPSSDKRCAGVNSSGVAAHPERSQAIKSSTLELIERDAFMNAYLGKLDLPTVTHKSLPGAILARINHIEENGFRVWVKDFSLDLAPVVFIFAQSEDLTFTTCASCCHFNRKKAVNHALMEVEQSVLRRLASSKREPIDPSEVSSVHDHGALYNREQYFQKANFLIDSGDTIAFKEMGSRVANSWEELLDQLEKNGQQLFTIPLYLEEDLGGNQGLHIIRSLVPGLVPIGFGYMQEPRGMERIRTIAKRLGNKSVTHRDMPDFPHPFI